MPATTKRGGGPKTPEGKAAVSRNAIKHGLLSRSVLLEYEDADDLDALAAQLHRQLAPVGPLETLLVDRIVAATWRLARAVNAETRQMWFAYVGSVENSAMADRYAKGVGVPVSPDAEEDAYNLAEARTITNKDLEKIARYETTIERQLYRALHELQTLQASRVTGMPLVPGSYHVTVLSPARSADAPPRHKKIITPPSPET